MKSASWYSQNAEEVLETFASSPQGLDTAEAVRRLDQYGPNELQQAQSKSMAAMFLDQFKDFMIIVLIVAAVISGVIGELVDTIAIIVIVVLNAVIGFVQEYRAEKAMEALRNMAGTTATVVRSGLPGTVSAMEIVPGDIVLLEAGNVVPADLRLIRTVDLKVDEASLTGESVPVEKHGLRLTGEKLAIGDRHNIVYRGTSITYGRASGVVTETGMQTELGRIAGLLQQAGELKTPLQQRLASFGKKLALLVLAICAIIFMVGILRGEEPLLMLLTAISLAVAAIPEALPAVVTISLALGAKKLVEQQALIRNLPAVETLGSVTYICSDKTGTLTMNQMRVERLYGDHIVLNRDDVPPCRFATDNDYTLGLWDWFMIGLAVSNDVHPAASDAIIGEPTEKALFTVAAENGYDKSMLEKHVRRVAEIPFDSSRKCMTTVHAVSGLNTEHQFVSFTKGALDSLLPQSSRILTSRGVQDVDRAALEEANKTLAADGMRIICLSMKAWDKLPENLLPEHLETGLTLLGLIGIMDPPRPEAAGAIARCRAAGIRPVMITGDHLLTAKTIAQRLKLLDESTDMTITGQDLAERSSADFAEHVEHIRVYARVAPEQKLTIVRALQERGQFVAMTGDGVNDAPALKAADIGVAMGITGTDVAKEAADMILLDDNFATIVNAVQSGRRIFDNIRKFIKYTMTSNSGEIWTIFLAPLLGLPIPLLPIHILWVNLVTDGLPGLALTAEPAEPGIMERPPRHPQESIFSNGLGTHIVWVGILMGGVSILMQAWSIKTGHAHWQTMVFTVLCLSQMGHVLAIRSETESIFSTGLLSNLPLFGAVLLTFFLQMATIYVPFLNPIFKTEPLTVSELLLALVMSSVVFWAVEIEKWRKRRRNRC